MEKKSEFRILVVDDVSEVRAVVEEFLTERGYQVSGVGSVRELLQALKDTRYDVIFLDIQLGEEIRIGDTYALFQKQFPEAKFSDEEVLRDFGLTSQHPASGRYLLPLIKAVTPETVVMMLTGAWRGEEEERILVDKYGAYLTVLKGAEDNHFRDSRHEGLDSRDRDKARKKLVSLDQELEIHLKALFKTAVEKSVEGTR